jgi:hypothetical protein
MRVGIGVSTAQDYTKAVRETIEKARSNISTDSVDLALVFSTPKLNHQLVLQNIAALLGNTPTLGINSSPIITNQGIIKHGLAIALFTIPEGTYLNAAYSKNVTNDNAHASGEELGDKLLYGCKNLRRNLSVVVTNTSISKSPYFISGLQTKLGKSFPLLGANIPNNLRHQKNMLFANGEIIDEGGWGILWGGRMSFSLVAKHGWQPLGKPHRVTSSTGNIVHEIGGQPAVNLYKEYFAKDKSSLLKDIEYISTLYPLGVRVSENNEYLLRSVVAIKDDGSLIFRGEIPENSTIRLMISSKESCLASAYDAAEASSRNMSGNKIKFALVLNSLSRYTLLGRQANQEAKIIRGGIGEDVPMLGVYTYAEQAPLNAIGYLGMSYFNNNSLAILSIAD